jgi:hypothetical protein
MDTCPYKAVFIIPPSAKKMLCSDGWLFESPDRLPPDTVQCVINSLNLQTKEKYDGVVAYEGSNIKASVFLDDACQAEQIYLQVKGSTFEVVVDKIKNALGSTRVEVFVP